MVYLLSRKVLVKVYLKLACDQYYIDSERNPTGGIVGRTPNNERRYVNMAVTGIGTYASYTNSYGNTQNAGNKTGRTYKNAHEYKNYLTQKIRMFTKQGLFRKYKQFSFVKGYGR